MGPAFDFEIKKPDFNASSSPTVDRFENKEIAVQGQGPHGCDETYEKPVLAPAPLHVFLGA